MLLDRIAKGFDFLGYSFEPKGLSIAPKTLANFLERKTQLYTPSRAIRQEVAEQSATLSFNRRSRLIQQTDLQYLTGKILSLIHI